MYTLNFMASLQKKISRGNTYWQIVESRRVNGKPRPIVLMHLGTADKLLRRLQEGSGKPVKARVHQFGALAALWNLAEELEVVKTIDLHAPKRNQGLSCGQYFLLATLNRCVGATSKVSLYDWYQKTVLKRILPTSKSSLTSQRFWDHMSYLDQDDLAAIEEKFTARLIEKFNINLRTLIFDATNFDTFIDTQNPCQIPQRGHAKSKRKDLRIIGLALLVSTDFNVPLLSHTYPGNQNDSSMFGNVTDELVARYRQFEKECKDITLIFDGGNNSKDNIGKIDKSPYHFISSLTLTNHKELLDVALRKFVSFEDKRLKGTTAYRTTKEVWGENRTVVVTRSEKLLQGQVAGINAALKKKRSLLNELRIKLHRSQQPKARGKGYTHQSLKDHLKSITSGQYISEIFKAEIIEFEGQLDFKYWTDSKAYTKLIASRLGKRILCTDNHHWTTEEIIIGSRSQSHVEDAFKKMKNPHWISFSPVFHWTDQKLRVHVSYCVLALTLSALLQRKAAQAGYNLSITALYEELSNITEVVNLYPSPDKNNARGRLRAEYTLSELSSLQEKLAHLFDIQSLTRK